MTNQLEEKVIKESYRKMHEYAGRIVYGKPGTRHRIEHREGKGWFEFNSAYILNEDHYKPPKKIFRTDDPSIGDVSYEAWWKNV